MVIDFHFSCRLSHTVTIENNTITITTKRPYIYMYNESYKTLLQLSHEDM